MVWLPLPKGPRLAPDSFPLNLLVLGCIAVLTLEMMAAMLLAHMDLAPMTALGALRCAQTALLLVMVYHNTAGWQVVGLDRRAWFSGWVWGTAGAALFALAALGGGAVLHLLGISPLALLRMTLPTEAGDRLLYFIVGGAIAPIAEELFFRGFLYGYSRRWGILPALLLSTAVFVALHLPSGLPVTQIVGGIVFALVYEGARSLIAPIVIHSLGNMAIFGLSLV